MTVQWTLLILGLLAGISRGCLAVACLCQLSGKAKELRLPGVQLALILLILGGIASFFHLHNPSKVFYVMGNMGSGISQELIATALAGIVIVAFWVLLKRKSSDTALKAIAIIGLIVALILPIITGLAYSVMCARPAWGTPLLPLLYLVAALVSGFLLMYAVAVAKRIDKVLIARLARLAPLAVGLFALGVALYLVGVATAPFQAPSRSVSLVLSGDLALLFWGLVVTVGIILPTILLAFAAKKQASLTEADAKNATLGLVICAFVGVVIGSTTIRVIVYLLGSSIQTYI